ncbi:DUF2126 domain-containing protein [Kineosporia sp. R_H_3]|uniref:transglutaminase family protein n=1 Tax=Kineosporia sp. R_H_3 TaxID=1961848 RepID=UPI000B4B480F|nr:transglutaminase family protein [Kineosporia sp. R_H_3]
MTIRVALEHRTTYRFDRPVTVHPHVVRLRPAPHCRTPITAYSLRVSPAEHFLNWQQDAFGNHLARLVFPERTRELEVVVDLVADMTVINPFDFFVEDYAERYPFDYPAGVKADLEPYLRRVAEPGSDGAPDGAGPGPLVRAWLADAAPVPAEGRRIVDFLVDVNQRLQRDVAYTVRMEPGVQTPDQTLGRALGSCRDSAWLLVSVLRELGLAARFVSGYLVQLAPDLVPHPDDPLGGPGGPTSDFTDLHAWTEVYVPGAGWVGLDPTSGLLAGEGHIPLSATPHPATSAPITGAVDPCEVSFDFSNTVRRVHEDVRVTRPYTAAQWERIDALGGHVDGLLEAGDVRLTMGGEPTFVAIDDMESPQWNTDADGPQKRARAAELAQRLRSRWAAGGVTHHGQGKWYPGEPLPRWAVQLTWRPDGEPLWRDPDLLDDPWGPPVPAVADAASSAGVVRDLAVAVAARLGVPREHVAPAYEDLLAVLLDEARRPAGPPPEVDADPDDEALRAPDRRAEVVGTFDVDPGVPAGWVVPLFRTEDGEAWGTARWRPRRRHLFLLPGTSPLGLRLPLDSIAWAPPPVTPEADPLAPRGALPTAYPPGAHPADSGAGGDVPSAEVVDIEKAPRTALTVQERDGHVFVFLPPLESLDDGLDLLSRVEDAAREVGVPVVLEGYPLPGDARVQTLSVTPDPGVIEVNVQPTRSWRELVDLTTTLYDDARAVRLGTEKFDLDGAHTGTGGGNHLTLGGPTPADSPLLRRPDLLRSLVTFWQHHPALSYVFSGRFIGPTSQAPRVDEGRHETLYELEIAFGELSRTLAETDDDGAPVEPRPWLVDRLLRHLLTDITGNTHRAEFCIDKLYSPDSARGRLGLLELRGFEMPPHAQMALVQALLVRSLVARFWETPYTGPLVRWAHRLHDRFLLPAFAAADLAEVTEDLRAHGIAFEDSWLEPFLEFRFPRLGEVDVAGVHLELRYAVEPWHVLGEEATGTGTARYVDSSVEKVQVAVTGLVEGRHAVTCNGVPVPLTPTATPGTSVGGIRYRAWAPPSALHPTIGVHSPLVVDLVDLWNGRSLGGFTYHVVHPGGRSYDTYPVNAAAAEARRAARFTATGHTPGPVDVAAWPSSRDLLGPAGGEYPCTLDLRRAGTMKP